jgi:hypothetical protein|tara:strand:- start:119 stop:1627 length:1509 start_codon:yes stop_codon:yes gene_type:complete
MAEYIVAMDPSTHADASAAETAITSAGGTILKTYGFNMTYKIEAEEAEKDAINGVLHHEGYDREAVITPSFNTNHLKMLCNDAGSTSTAYNPSSTGSGEHIYLVDTGVNTTHDEFSGRTVNNLYTGFGSGTDYTDTDGHGTSMASLIIGANIGTAKDATLHNVRAMDSTPYTGTIGAMIDALDACLVHHNANTPSQTKPVVCCWTTAKNNLLDAKFSELEENNMIVVCSAGNNAGDVDFYSPAGLDRVMTVGGHNASLNVGYFTATTGSNLGPEVDVFGMSDDVSIINFSNNSAYTTADGTSVATAQIGGLALQYIDLYPSADARTIKSYITSEGYVSGRGMSLTFDANLLTATGQVEANLKKSIGVSPQVGDLQLSAVPSGLVLTVANGQSANVNVQINASASNVSVMNFSPVPPWATFANTGASIGTITVDTSSNMANVTVPGIYHFAVRGEVSGTVLVEEYSIGIYTSDVNELDTSAEFYYDDANSDYDQVVNFNATKE